MYGPRKKHFKPVVLPFHDEEGIALVSSSRGLGHEKNHGSYRRFRGNICSRSVALFLGLLVLAATYRVGREMGGGSGGNATDVEGIDPVGNEGTDRVSFAFRRRCRRGLVSVASCLFSWHAPVSPHAFSVSPFLTGLVGVACVLRSYWRFYFVTRSCALVSGRIDVDRIGFFIDGKGGWGREDASIIGTGPFGRGGESLDESFSPRSRARFVSNSTRFYFQPE